MTTSQAVIPPLKYALLLCLLALLVGFAQAQAADGQFCVRAYEDRNSNGQRDAGEPLLSAGIGANLVDATGVIVRSALIENSATNAQGLICFENLSQGQYTLFVTSAEYFATGVDNLTVSITDDPATRTNLFEFGGQSYASLLPASAFQTAESGTLSNQAIERILIAAIGAMIAMIGTAFIGLVLYMLFLRGRAQRASQAAAYYDPRVSTGSMRAVQPPTDTGEFRRR